MRRARPGGFLCVIFCPRVYFSRTRAISENFRLCRSLVAAAACQGIPSNRAHRSPLLFSTPFFLVYTQSTAFHPDLLPIAPVHIYSVSKDPCHLSDLLPLYHTARFLSFFPQISFFLCCSREFFSSTVPFFREGVYILFYVKVFVRASFLIDGAESVCNHVFVKSTGRFFKGVGHESSRCSAWVFQELLPGEMMGPPIPLIRPGARVPPPEIKIRALSTVLTPSLNSPRPDQQIWPDPFCRKGLLNIFSRIPSFDASFCNKSHPLGSQLFAPLITFGLKEHWSRSLTLDFAFS